MFNASADIERLTKLLFHYETANMQQKQDLEDARIAYESNIKTIGDLEKLKISMSKRIKTLEGTLKFEKMGSDGLRKKFNLIEVEVIDLRAEKENLTKELFITKERVKELDETMFTERANRLRLMHENDVLRRKNISLEVREHNAESEAQGTREDLQSKLQRLETLIAINETQERTIKAQSEELLSLAQEVYSLKEKLFDANKRIVSHDVAEADANKHIGMLQAEVNRLRRELTMVSLTHSERSMSHSNDFSSSRYANRVTTALISRDASATKGLHLSKSQHYLPAPDGGLRDRRPTNSRVSTAISDAAGRTASLDSNSLGSDGPGRSLASSTEETAAALKLSTVDDFHSNTVAPSAGKPSVRISTSVSMLGDKKLHPHSHSAPSIYNRAQTSALSGSIAPHSATAGSSVLDGDGSSGNCSKYYYEDIGSKFQRWEEDRRQQLQSQTGRRPLTTAGTPKSSGGTRLRQKLNEVISPVATLHRPVNLHRSLNG